MRERWLELKASGRPETGERAAELFIEAGSPAVVEEGPARLLASIREADSERLPGLALALKGLGWRFAAKPLSEGDWETAWRRGLGPVRVFCGGRSVLIRTTWSRARPRPGEIEITIDPAMAFGTGHHPTTRLSIRAILKVFSMTGPPERLLDLGTGTGVLAIAAKKLGAGKILAIDIDPEALREARKNIRRSGLDIKVSGRPVEKIKGNFPVIAANILSGRLIQLAPFISRLLPAEGRLILSGILREEAEGVARAYRPYGLVPTGRFSMNRWCALILKNTGGAR